jgi:hypothetical protein
MAEQGSIKSRIAALKYVISRPEVHLGKWP